MKQITFAVAFVVVLLVSVQIRAQRSSTVIAATTVDASRPNNKTSKRLPVHTTAAYAEVYAQKIETEADLKALLIDYNDEAPDVRAKKLELNLFAREIRWLEALPPESLPKLTLAMGRILVRKTQAEMNLKNLLQSYSDEHPLVKKAKARLTVYTDEVAKLLQ